MTIHRSLAALCVLVGIIAGTGSSARADQVDNPLFKAWHSFKPGSTRTLEGTLSLGAMSIKTEMTSTLKEVADDHVTVETTTTSTINGQTREGKPTTKSIPAKADEKDLKQIGEENVDAMGKTYKCKVWTMDSDAAGAGAGAGSAKGTAKVWTADEVPGGAVKFDVQAQRPGAAAIQITYLLTKFEAK